MHGEFSAVNFDIGSIKMFLEDAGLKIGQSFHRIGKFSGFAILQHHSAVFIICIYEGKGIRGKIIEKRLLHVPVFQHIFVIIEMILGEIGKDSSNKTKSIDPLLMNSMRAYFHESMTASGIHHLSEVAIQCDGVDCGMGGFITIIIHIIGHSGKQSRRISQVSEHFVEQSGNGCFAVGTGHPYKL